MVATRASAATRGHTANKESEAIDLGLGADSNAHTRTSDASSLEVDALNADVSDPFTGGGHSKLSATRPRCYSGRKTSASKHNEIIQEVKDVQTRNEMLDISSVDIGTLLRNAAPEDDNYGNADSGLSVYYGFRGGFHAVCKLYKFNEGNMLPALEWLTAGLFIQVVNKRPNRKQPPPPLAPGALPPVVIAGNPGVDLRDGVYVMDAWQHQMKITEHTKTTGSSLFTFAMMNSHYSKIDVRQMMRALKRVPPLSPTIGMDAFVQRSEIAKRTSKTSAYGQPPELEVATLSKPTSVRQSNTTSAPEDTFEETASRAISVPKMIDNTAGGSGEPFESIDSNKSEAAVSPSNHAAERPTRLKLKKQSGKQKYSSFSAQLLNVDEPSLQDYSRELGAGASRPTAVITQTHSMAASSTRRIFERVQLGTTVGGRGVEAMSTATKGACQSGDIKGGRGLEQSGTKRKVGAELAFSSPDGHRPEEPRKRKLILNVGKRHKQDGSE